MLECVAMARRLQRTACTDSAKRRPFSTRKRMTAPERDRTVKSQSERCLEASTQHKARTRSNFRTSATPSLRKQERSAPETQGSSNMKKQSEVHPEVKRTAGTTGKRRRRTPSPRSEIGTTWGGHWKVLLLLGTLWTGSPSGRWSSACRWRADSRLSPDPCGRGSLFRGAGRK